MARKVTTAGPPSTTALMIECSRGHPRAAASAPARRFGGPGSADRCRLPPGSAVGSSWAGGSSLGRLGSIRLGGSGGPGLRGPVPRAGSSAISSRVRPRPSAAEADDLALVHDRDAVGEGVDLVELGGDDDHGVALSRCATIGLWTNSIEPTSRPRVGWLASSTLSAADLAGDDDLLLVAAGQVAGRGLRPTGSACRTRRPGVTAFSWIASRSSEMPEANGGRS